MDTIDSSVMYAATTALERQANSTGLSTITTVTITLNRQHGGADVVIHGDVPLHESEIAVDGWVYERVTIKLEVH
jgi:hypothetical protein